jgi:asparagine synthase (glutamine-hydrolysing)
MCGIIGSLSAVPVSEESLLRGLRSLTHRGPDDSGWQRLSVQRPRPLSVFLASQRLAILDLSSAGHQPMQDPATGNWIVYNGEIYNFKQVRSQLENNGAVFRSHCDTEVVLQAYAGWGEDCLSHFRGMFAFAIWDAKRQRLFLARDRFGEKPLYYALKDDSLLFASEVRALLNTGLLPRKVNFDGVLQYLAFGSVQHPETCVEGIHALLPAHYMVWESGQVRQVKYWDLHSSAKNGVSGEAEGSSKTRFGEELRALLEEAVLLCTVSDVPIGVFLSGGIDSSVLTALLARRGADLKTFSVVFKELDYSEAKYSRQVAAQFHTEHHELLLSQQDALQSLPDAILSMDQPTVDGVNTFIVCREAHAQGLKVALSGLGGDEMFAGYNTFTTVPRMERFAWIANGFPAAGRAMFASLFRGLTPINSKNQKLATLIGGCCQHPYLLSRLLFVPQAQPLLTTVPRGDFWKIAQAPLQSSLQRSQDFDPINRVSYLELRNYMANTLLRDADFMSMSHSLEVRIPFIDHKLAEYLFTIPGPDKMSKTPKHLLLNTVGDLLPEEVSHRPKRGFELPFEIWLRDQLRKEVENVLLSDDTMEEILAPGAINWVWNEFLNGHVSWSRPWSLYVLKKWVGTFLA